MHRISHLTPDYVSERLAAVEDVGRAWVMVVVVAALTFGMSFIEFA
jgi:hypothetical protein